MSKPYPTSLPGLSNMYTVYIPYKLRPISWDKLGRGELLASWNEPKLRGCPVFEHNFFAHESMFGSWVPRIAYTKNWPARSCAILDKIGSPKKLEKPNFRRRDFWEQNFGKLEKIFFTKIVYSILYTVYKLQVFDFE